ncbi:MAG: hypothetical protein HRT45_00250 [Bdellovibrionales bacterium]|nr:hypothetical protein [Bdellovibrionales bacterium]
MLTSHLADADDLFEYTPELQSRMLVEAENLLAEFEDQADVPPEKRLSQNGAFRRAFLAMGKDHYALASAWSARILNRYPEMLPSFLSYNVAKYLFVIVPLYVAGYWKTATAYAVAPDSFVLIAAYAGTRFPYDIISNRVRSDYWFYQIFQRRDELLGLRPENPVMRWPYFSSKSRFQFFNMTIPIGVVDGEVQYDEIFLPIRRLGSMRLMEEMLLPKGLLADVDTDATIDQSLGERGWLHESQLTSMIEEEMGEDEFTEFMQTLGSQTLDARLRQMAMLEWLLENSLQLSEINRGLLKLRISQLSPLSKTLANIEMTRSEIQFHKKVLKRTSREERRIRREQEHLSWPMDRLKNFRYYWSEIKDQAYQGKIIRRLNALELEIVAADLSGNQERIENALKEARAYLFAINLEHQIETTATPNSCQLRLLTL